MKIIDYKKELLNADIRVVGVGGGGSNAVETMVKSGIKGVRFISVNTDAQALSSSIIETTIQLGAKLTKGLGAGANPEVGHRAAIESYDEIAKSLQGADMVFITAGMGGGTGTGGAPVIAEIAKQQGALTVGVVTRPFLFEGNRRKKHAEKGIEELKSHVDTLIIIPNDKLLAICDEKTPLIKTFQKTDDILLQAVKGIAELISLKGLINLDFADIKTVMSNKGMAVMGLGVAQGKNRAIEAVSHAVSSPLLENASIAGAKGVIVNVTAGLDLSLSEVHQATALLTEVVDEDADIIVGAVVDKNMGDSLSVTVIVTGFDESFEQEHSLSNNIKSHLSFLEKTQKEKSAPVITSEPAKPEVACSPEDSVSEPAAVECSPEDSVSELTEELPIEEINETKEEIPQNSKEENRQAEPPVLATKDILLSKAKQYAKNQSQTKEELFDDEQINIEWENTSSGEETSPFESEIEFKDEDAVS